MNSLKGLLPCGRSNVFFYSERKGGNELILVTADKRLVTAAKAEGLQVINPETATLAEIEKLLQSDSPAAPKIE